MKIGTPWKRASPSPPATSFSIRVSISVTSIRRVPGGGAAAAQRAPGAYDLREPASACSRAARRRHPAIVGRAGRARGTAILWITAAVVLERKLSLGGPGGRRSSRRGSETADGGRPDRGADLADDGRPGRAPGRADAAGGGHPLHGSLWADRADGDHRAPRGGPGGRRCPVRGSETADGGHPGRGADLMDDGHPRPAPEGGRGGRRSSPPRGGPGGRRSSRSRL